MQEIASTAQVTVQRKCPITQLSRILANFDYLSARAKPTIYYCSAQTMDKPEICAKKSEQIFIVAQVTVQVTILVVIRAAATTVKLYP